MQQNQKTIYEKCVIGITTLIWVAGLLIAGSDSIYMPWVNGIGLVLFLFSTVILGRLLRENQSSGSMVIFPKFSLSQRKKIRTDTRKNCRVNIRYAMQVR